MLKLYHSPLMYRGRRLWGFALSSGGFKKKGKDFYYLVGHWFGQKCLCVGEAGGGVVMVGTGP